MKLMTILGTRPDLIKMSRILPVLDECFEHVFVHTGQNYDWELNGIFFKELGIRQPDDFLACPGKTLAETVANILVRTDEMLEKHKPDAVLYYGDTNSIMGCYAAKRRKIPIFHMEAGNRSFDPRVPEETNRKIIDHLADVNMCNSEHARRYLLAEGLPPDRTFKTGSPMMEVLLNYLPKIKNSAILETLKLKQGEYFVVSLHREENVDNQWNLTKLRSELNALVDKHNMRAIFSCHPRTRKKLGGGDHPRHLDTRIEVMKPMGFFDYVYLQMNALCTVSDSGSIWEEASILAFPAVTIRQAHERPEGVDVGAVLMSGVSNLCDAVDIILKREEAIGMTTLIPDYDVSNVSWKVANIIQSYTDYVNRVAWRKSL